MNLRAFDRRTARKGYSYSMCNCTNLTSRFEACRTFEIVRELVAWRSRINGAREVFDLDSSSLVLVYLVLIDDPAERLTSDGLLATYVARTKGCT
jgi:hypothetical protein